LIDMSEYLPKLCDSLKEALMSPEVVLTAAAERVNLPPDKALPIGLIVNELVTNAVKYAYGEGQNGHVLVDLSSADGRIRLVVRDDGRGYPADAEAGLGSRLVTTLAAQLGGVATWEGPEGGGTITRIEFPA
jgi:two-component sensor histidine kinase